MKKYISLFIILFLTTASSVAQIVTTTPEFPTDNVPVTIIFDATKGTAGLKGYTGDVYAHTGLITNKSTSASDWKYAPTWGVNTEKYKLQPLGNDKWQLEITPDIRTYYGVAAGETVKQLAFVFRSDDASKEGKDNGGKDIFADVYSNAFAIRIEQPAQGEVLNVNETGTIKATASKAANLTLYIDGTQIHANNNATEITTTHTFTETGVYEIKAQAQSGGETVFDTRQINVLGATENAPLPNGVRPGINYISNTEVTLVLQAPGKKNVYAVGDFNNWTPLPAYQLKRDGEYFWVTLTGLTPGQEYAFQYLVDGTIYVADPYTEKVLDPWNDSSIPAAVYPDLKAYPTGKATGIVSVLQTARQPYNWQTPKFTGPAKEQLIIYEMLIRDFTTAHSYKAAIERLDYLKTLGVNAIELMPVNEFEGNSSWGYNPAFYFAPDKYYGTANDLKQFVDECHARGMAVILDVVLNHSYGQSPFYLLYRDNDGKPSASNPWYNQQSNISNPGLQWGYDFNHESSYTKALVDSVASFWMTEYRMDGFRYDFTKGFSNTAYPNTSDWASSYDAARIAILKRMAGEVWKRNPNAYVIFEHLATTSEENELGKEGIMLWRNMNNAYCQSAMGFSSDSGFSALYAGTSMPSGSLVGYMESHDEERMTYKAKTYGDGNLKTYLSEQMKLARVNAAFFLTVPGPKMIWQFGELGYDYSIDYNGRLGEKPVKWDYYSNSYRKGLYDTYGKLLTLRKNIPELFALDAIFSWKVSASDWANGRFITSVAGNKAMVIAGNFTSASGQYAVTFPSTGTWYDYISGASLEVTSATQTITVPAREFRLYINFDPVLVGIEETPAAYRPSAFYNYRTDQLVVTGGETAIAIEIYSIDGMSVMRQEHVSAIGLSMIPTGYYIAKVYFSNGTIESCKIVK